MDVGVWTLPVLVSGRPEISQARSSPPSVRERVHVSPASAMRPTAAQRAQPQASGRMTASVAAAAVARSHWPRLRSPHPTPRAARHSTRRPARCLPLEQRVGRTRQCVTREDTLPCVRRTRGGPGRGGGSALHSPFAGFPRTAGPRCRPATVRRRQPRTASRNCLTALCTSGRTVPDAARSESR